jgi:hypothetical protein
MAEFQTSDQFQISKGTIAMTIDFKGLAAAALLLTALNFPCYAEDATTTAPAASDQATQGDAKPRDVQRPALTARSADTAPDATTEPAPRHRHYARRHYYRHLAYWEPFPVFLPHFFHNRITWNRVSWFRF